jgi:hypothetical protein
LSHGKKREGVKKILVHEVFDGVALEREEWVSDDAYAFNDFSVDPGHGVVGLRDRE